MSSSIVFLVVASSVLHASWNFAARKVSGDIGVLWLALCFASALGAPFALRALDASAVRYLPYVVATGVLNAAYFLLVARAYEAGEISEVYPIARGVGVAGAGFTGSLIVGEPMSWGAAMGITAVCAGILILSLKRVPARREREALAYALLVGVNVVVAALVDKLAMRIADPVVYMFGMYFLAAVVIAPYVWRRHRDRCARAWRTGRGWSAFIGAGSFISYLLIMIAFRRAGPLSRIAAFRELSIVLGSLMGVFVLRESMTPRKGLGIAVIAAGLVLIKLA